MKGKRSAHFQLLALLVLVSAGCLTTKTPTISFSEYRLDPGPSQSQKNADVEITLKAIQLSDIYSYPNLFSFNLDLFPNPYRSNGMLRSEYKVGIDGKSWEYPFSTPDGKYQLLLCYCKVKNNTKHILRMGDARIYFVVEGLDPFRAISTYEELLESADYFQAETNKVRSTQTNWGILAKELLPPGFYREIIEQNRRGYKLINDLKHEILPGFSYEGILAFPAAPSIANTAAINFFDVTIRTDQAGNPTEKTRFEFKLRSDWVHMYYDIGQKKWIVGRPPVEEIAPDEDELDEKDAGESSPEDQGTEDGARESISNRAAPKDSSVLVVKVASANIRQEPNLKSKIISSAKMGAHLKLIGVDGDWYEILLDNGADLMTGYIFRTLVDKK